MDMTLYETWIKTAYDQQGQTNKKFWNSYMPLETQVYEDILAEGTGIINMPLGDFAKKYNLRAEYAVGFLDGIGGALDEAVDVEKIDVDYVIDIKINFEKLFKKMVEYKAKHLYTLPGWENLFSTEQQEVMIDEQRRSGTFTADEKPGRNDPCHCNSGKKYKKCCGQSA
jgi:hypothetical protein